MTGTRTAPTGTPGPSVRVTTTNGLTQVISSPYPIHRAVISRSHVLGRWLVVVETAQLQVRDFRELTAALRHAGTIIGTLYRVDMRSRFTGPQRHTMAMGHCPAHVPCDDRAACLIERPDHSHLCKRNPDFASIWCDRHESRVIAPRGPVR